MDVHLLTDRLLGAVLALLLVFALTRDVTRARLERFARRQTLTITVANGPMVIRYLAVTRRWRSAGALCGIAIAAICTFTQHRPLHPGAAGALVGWLVGAVIAEWRVASLQPNDSQRVAALSRRTTSDYVPRALLLANVVAWSVVAVFAGCAVVSLTSREGAAIVAESVLALCAGPAIYFVAAHVVSRPQPIAQDDVLAADDALRSRSLHVLAGSALALAGIVIAVIDSAAGSVYGHWLAGQWDTVVSLIGTVLLPLLGWVAATTPSRPRRGVLVTAGSDT